MKNSKQEKHWDLDLDYFSHNMCDHQRLNKTKLEHPGLHQLSEKQSRLSNDLNETTSQSMESTFVAAESCWPESNNPFRWTMSSTSRHRRDWAEVDSSNELILLDWISLSEISCWLQFNCDFFANVKYELSLSCNSSSWRLLCSSSIELTVKLQTFLKLLWCLQRLTWTRIIHQAWLLR